MPVTGTIRTVVVLKTKNWCVYEEYFNHFALGFKCQQYAFSYDILFSSHLNFCALFIKTAYMNQRRLNNKKAAFCGK
jgi:hypothetical protein